MTSTVDQKFVDVLLKQNAELEKLVKKLCTDLEDTTNGILMRGYLYKFRDRVISFQSKWSLKYVVLRGSSLSYYVDEHHHHPTRTIDLENCMIRNEGLDKTKKYHIFAIYLEQAMLAERGPETAPLLRLSSESSTEALKWISMLERACGMHLSEDEEDETPTSLAVEAPAQKNRTSIDTSILSELPAPIVTRVRSSEQLISQTTRRISPKKRPNSISTTPVPITTPKQRSFPASKSIHVTAQPSALSAKARHQDYRGLLNLGALILVVSHCRVIIDNLTKYGLLMQNRVSWSITGDHLLYQILPQPSLAVASWAASILAVYLLEIVSFRLKLHEKVSFAIHVVLSLLNLILPCYWVYASPGHPAASLIYLIQSLIIWMKLISYAHVNRDVRIAYRNPVSVSAPVTPSNSHAALAALNASDTSSENTPIFSPKSLSGAAKTASEMQGLELPILQYPDNLTLMNLLYFCVVPTLCYQLNYPRSPNIRWKYIGTILVRMIICGALILFFTEQYIVPALEGSLVYMEARDLFGVFQRLLMISVPNTYVWMLGFYFFFHLWLNLIAELTRFGDRLFYRDWWNSRTIDEYWRLWNLPVHHWMLRHLYHPMLRNGASKTLAVFTAFLFSAAFHEILTAIPFRTVSFYAFLGMLGQAPLVYISRAINDTFDNPVVGNCMFWLTFCIIGQPAAVIMYYYDIWKANQLQTCA